MVSYRVLNNKDSQHNNNKDSQHNKDKNVTAVVIGRKNPKFNSSSSTAEAGANKKNSKDSSSQQQQQSIISIHKPVGQEYSKITYDLSQEPSRREEQGISAPEPREDFGSSNCFCRP